MHSLFRRVIFVACLIQQACFALTKPLLNRRYGEFNAETIFQFSNGSWIENLAVRSNGNLLLTRADTAQLFLLDPAAENATAQSVAQFPGSNVTLGIAETSPDKFAVIAGNLSLQFGPTNGSFSIWSVDFNNASSSSNGTSSNGSLAALPSVSKIAAIPQAIWLDGLAAVDQNTVLAGDLFAGNIYSVNVKTGNFSIASSPATNPVLAPAFNPVLQHAVSVNGLRVHNNFAYFTTSGTNIVAKAPILAHGAKLGNASIIAQGLNSSDPLAFFDDFAVDHKGDLFLATQGENVVEQLSPAGRGTIIAGALNSTAIAEPTSAQFGRGAKDKNTLYVTTAGGLAVPVQPGGVPIGAQVVAVDLSGKKTARIKRSRRGF